MKVIKELIYISVFDEDTDETLILFSTAFG
jgi:hypothetical protein